MTSIAVNCCDLPCVEAKSLPVRPRRPAFEWSSTDLDIQAFIRLASGGVEAGFDRILLK